MCVCVTWCINCLLTCLKLLVDWLHLIGLDVFCDSVVWVLVLCVGFCGGLLLTAAFVVW